MMTWERFATDLPLLLGAVILVVTAITHFFPPKKINPLYGYRTPGSMRSPERWTFAQSYSTRRMFEASLVLLLTGILLLSVNFNPFVQLWIGIAELILMPAYLVISTERALKQNFP